MAKRKDRDIIISQQKWLNPDSRICPFLVSISHFHDLDLTLNSLIR